MKTELKNFREVKSPVNPKKGERWAKLDINSRTKYLISTRNRIYSFERKRILKGKITEGNIMFDYTPTDKKNLLSGINGKKRKINNNGRVSMTYGRLVAETFIKRPPKATGMVIHKDYNRWNNNVENLLWQVEGELHSVKSPAWRASRCKVTLAMVIKVNALLKRKAAGKLDITIKEIGEKFDVSDMTIYRIRKGDIWHYVKPEQRA